MISFSAVLDSCVTDYNASGDKISEQLIKNNYFIEQCAPNRRQSDAQDHHSVSVASVNVPPQHVQVYNRVAAG